MLITRSRGTATGAAGRGRIGAVTTPGTRALVRRMKAIREPHMRVVIAGEFLRRGAPERVVATVRALLGETQVRADPAYYAATDAVAEALTRDETVSYDRRADLYAAAVEAGAAEVARLFFSRSPNDATDPDVLEPERRVEPRGRVLTLGERKSLARTHRRDLIEHLVRDPHPEVIAILLDNPHVIERDVVAVAARRPAAAAVLERIARHGRWRVRYPIKRALVLNPHTPIHLSLRLVASLRPSDLRAVADDPALVEILRQQAADLVEASG